MTMRLWLIATFLCALLSPVFAQTTNPVTPGYAVCSSASGSTQCGWVNGQGPGFDAVVTPVVQNAAYSSGNAIGGLITLAALRQPGNPYILNNISVWSKGGSTTAITFYVFKSAPSAATTCTDKSAFVLANADIPKLIPAAPVVLTPAVVGAGTTATTASNQSPVQTQNTENTQNIYVCAVVGGSVTPATTSDVVFDFAGLQN